MGLLACNSLHGFEGHSTSFPRLSWPQPEPGPFSIVVTRREFFEVTVPKTRTNKASVYGRTLCFGESLYDEISNARHSRSTKSPSPAMVTLCPSHPHVYPNKPDYKMVSAASLGFLLIAVVSSLRFILLLGSYLLLRRGRIGRRKADHHLCCLHSLQLIASYPV